MVLTWPFRMLVLLIKLNATRKESPFITELIKDYAIGVLNADGTASTEELCPTCGEGFLVLKKSGQFGSYMGCSNYPTCRHTRKFERGVYGTKRQ